MQWLRSPLADLCSPHQGRIRLADNRLWTPMHGKKINLTEVEDYIRQLDRRFQLNCVAFDPWQAEHLAQRLEFEKQIRLRSQTRLQTKPWMREVPPTSTNLRDMAGLVIECFVDRRLELYECSQLRNDLVKLRVEEKSYGVRLVSPRDSSGHGDTFSAFGLALLLAHEAGGKKKRQCGAIDLDGSLYGEVPRRGFIEQLLHEERF
ncbi:MAG: hypothetical protein R3C28_20985 [Pirellulaceae bacterium]